MSESPHIVYVAGVSHSGSTLLDLLLGSHSRLQGLGELKVLSRRKQAKRGRVLSDRCTCGAPFKLACDFWRKVDARLQRRLGVDLQEIDVDSADSTTFIRHNLALFEAIAEVGDSPWLVDSSKSPRRLRRLLDCSSFDVLPILLERDARGVTYSHVRKGRGVVEGAFLYAKARVRLEVVLSRQDPPRVRYEDLVSDPEAALAPAMARLGLEFEESQLDWANAAQHQICGNHMRFATTSEMRLDEAWKDDLSRLQQGVVAALTWPARLTETMLGGHQPSRTSR